MEMKQWAANYSQCIKCNKTDKPHKGHGRCKSCYEQKRDRTTESSRKSQKKYRSNNKDKIAESQRRSLVKTKISVLTLLGNKCIECGFSDVRALQIDHVNGGGTKEMKDFKGNYNRYYKNVILSVNNNENKYQLLCANCNWIKRHLNNECQ